MRKPREHTSKELLDLFRLHLELFEKYSNEETQQFKSLRRFFKIYVRGIRGASELRHQLVQKLWMKLEHYLMTLKQIWKITINET